MKKIIKLVLLLSCLSSIAIASTGIESPRIFYQAAEATQNVAATSTTINHTIPGYITIAPIDGDVRVLGFATSSSSADASCILVKQGGYWSGSYYNATDIIKAISTAGNVIVRVITEKYKTGPQ